SPARTSSNLHTISDASSARLRLAPSARVNTLSSMTATSVDATNHQRIASLGERVLNGDHITRAEALFLINLEATADILDLLSWSNRIREKYKGNKIHLCSIVNAKAGSCSENCSFCAQSAHYQTGSPKYGFVDP